MSKFLDDQYEERLKIMGLGSQSKRKSFYGELKHRLEELNDFRNLLDQSNDIILLLSHPGHMIRDVNLMGSSILEYERSEILSINFQSIIESSIFKGFKFPEGSKQLFRAVLLTRTGKKIPVEINATMVKRKSGEHIVIVARDITDRLDIEDKLRILNTELEKRVAERTEKLQEAQHQLIESEKMAALGSLVAGVAHEINTPLGIAFTSVTFLETPTKDIIMDTRNKTASEEKINSYLNKVSEATSIIRDNLQRAIDLIQHFKQIAVDQSIDLVRTVNISKYLSDIIISLKPIIRNHFVKINVPEALSVDTYPGALYQIFSNLVVNSVIHGFRGKQKGTISIECSIVNDMTVFDYSDNGSGIAEEYRKKIFEPFFTTRRDEGGSGLGLHIVYNTVVQTLKGTIKYKPNESGGVCFHIEIPLISSGISNKPS
jgi:PAS domain S-box-containing protein